MPDRIKRLVYLDAFVPRNGESMRGLLGPRWNDIQSMIHGGYVVPKWVKPDQPPPHDEPQSVRTMTDGIVLRNDAARKLPATYILTVAPGTKTEDDEFYAQSLRAKAFGWPVLQLSSDHNPQWSAPQALVELLASIH